MMNDMLEAKKEPRVKNGVYNPDSGMPPPQDIDGASVTPSKSKQKASAPKKYAKGGMTRGDGCASKGKTKGRMI